MADDKAVYVLLGMEIQDKVNYGMPVKSGLYDMIGYANQVEEAGRSYRKKEEKKKGTEETNIAVEKGELKIKLSNAEFLSGWRKEDRLMPVITAVIFFNDMPWDGPRDLFDMIDIRDERLIPFLNNYKLNLISAADMKEEDFGKFHTSLGLVLNIVKKQRNGADKVIEDMGHKLIDHETAHFLNRVARLGLEYEEKEVIGAIEAYRDFGASNEDIIERIIKKFNVTRDYVMALLEPQKA